MICAVYDTEPHFPATDQHPDAVRYFKGGRVIDAVGGEPSDIELAAAVNPATATTADNVRAEASRRLQLMFGARSDTHLNMIIANATREAVRLQNIKLSGQEWTPEQTTRAAQLVAADLAVEAIRAASNVMEPNPPQDYADDKHWPK